MSEILVEDSRSSRCWIKKHIINNNIVPYQCSLCYNKGQWLGQKLRLHLDHINGIRNDNRIENLRFLCPNCHDLQGTSHRKKGFNYNKVPKISVQSVIEARKTEVNIRQILLKLGVAEATPNYQKVKAILEKANASFPVGIIITGKRELHQQKGLPKFKLRRVERPSREELTTLLSKFPLSQIRKQYGLKSDASVIKWCKQYNIDHTKICPFSHKFKKHARVAELSFELSNRNLSENAGETPVTSAILC